MSADGRAVVLVHGAWHGAWAWERVVPLLEARGLPVRTLDLPSVGAPAGDPGALTGDAAAVARTLDEAGGASVLCGHSYGGMVVTKAAEGRGDIGRLVYLCAFMPEAGQSLVDITGGPAPWIRRLEDGRTLPDLGLAPDLFYGDCDAETQRRAAERIRPMLGAPFAEPVGEAAWQTIPSTYVVCTQDNAIPVGLQREVFAPRATDAVELEASHSPFFSQPETVADLLAARASG
jgi:pimeloyl-ACP methyl ester carboxylesterase